MNERTSFKVYKWWREADQRFDYFVAGLCAALAGYMGQSFHPGKLGWNPPTVETLSILCFVAALFCSLRRIESITRALLVNSKLLEAQETLKDLERDSEQEEPGEIRQAIEHIDGNCTRALLRLKKREVGVHDAHLKEIQGKALRYYSIRNYLLVGGLLLLLTARIWQAYR